MITGWLDLPTGAFDVAVRGMVVAETSSHVNASRPTEHDVYRGYASPSHPEVVVLKEWLGPERCAHAILVVPAVPVPVPEENR